MSLDVLGLSPLEVVCF